MTKKFLLFFASAALSLNFIDGMMRYLQDQFPRPGLWGFLFQFSLISFPFALFGVLNALGAGRRKSGNTRKFLVNLFLSPLVLLSLVASIGLFSFYLFPQGWGSPGHALFICLVGAGSGLLMSFIPSLASGNFQFGKDHGMQVVLGSLAGLALTLPNMLFPDISFGFALFSIFISLVMGGWGVLNIKIQNDADTSENSNSTLPSDLEGANRYWENKIEDFTVFPASNQSRSRETS